MAKLKRGIDRLIDNYAEGVIDNTFCGACHHSAGNIST
jgi:hypothetical protein